jgi:hypothetical protein
VSDWWKHSHALNFAQHDPLGPPAAHDPAEQFVPASSGAPGLVGTPDPSLAVAGLRNGDQLASAKPRPPVPAPPGLVRFPFCTIGVGTIGAVGASDPGWARAWVNEHSPAANTRENRFMTASVRMP